MKKNIIVGLILCLFFDIAYLYAEGFLADTLVKTPSKCLYIEQLQPKDTIISCCVDSADYHIPSIISKISNSSGDFFIQINIGNTKICCAPNQQFYSYNQQQWIRADSLTLDDFLMNDSNTAIAIDSLEYIEQSCILHSLTLTANHTYYVSEHNIIAHNALPIMMASTVIIESVIAPIIKTCLAAGTALLGVHFAKRKMHQHYAGNIDSHSSSSNYNSYYPDPNDPNDDKNKTKNEHPHGIYKDAPYHHKNAYGNKSKCPNDGQRCLDYSICVGNKRVAIEGDGFVVLHRTQPGEYHGFKVPWKHLEDDLRAVLIKHGFVRKTGKIIRQITEKFSS